jgi:outer membrane protein assembly factor BamB
VGIVGLHFDGAGMIYVNTTTANPDKIKYSRQIDIAENIDSILLKVDAKTGRNLWTAKTGGFACYVFGPFLYTMQSHDRIEDDMASDLTSGLQKAAFLKIFRLDPKNGHTLWEYDDTGAPLDVCFDKNIISLVFHTQVEVLKYLSL